MRRDQLLTTGYRVSAIESYVGRSLVWSRLLESRARRNEITQHCTPVRLLPVATGRSLTGTVRVCVCVVSVAVHGQTCPLRGLASSGSVTVRTAVSSVGRLVRRGISISNHLYSSTHSCRGACVAAAAAVVSPLGLARPTLFLTYLFSAPVAGMPRLIPLLCAFYFTQRSISK